jgi:hypothetical protein
MKKNLLLCIGLLVGSIYNAVAQRYQTEVFSSVKTTTNVTYGHNHSVIPTAFDPVGFQPFLPADSARLYIDTLKMDVYEPNGDTATDRPLVIYIHTGNFLPKVVNGSATGNKDDKAAVEICNRYAKRGYVAASINYRLGWNPLASTQEVRTALLLNAVYRAILDTKSAVRYFRKNAAVDGNEFGIDASKVILVGQGSGGYVALAYVTLDKNAEMEISKFLFAANGTPYVNRAIWGNIDGTSGLVNVENNTSYSAAVNMSINLGGALADTSWLEAGDVPMVSFQCIRDPFAPFGNGTVIVPTTNQNVVDVSGASVFMVQAHNYGNNSAFASMDTEWDVYTTRARSMYNKVYPYIYPAPNDEIELYNAEGLYAFDLADRTSINRLANQGSPWDWWVKAELDMYVAGYNAVTGSTYNADTIHFNGLLSNPDMSEAKAKLYIDTIIGYSIPRVVRVLQLPGYETINVNELLMDKKEVTLYPNPSNGQFTISTGDMENTITEINVFDLSGRMIWSKTQVNQSIYEVSSANFSIGTYIVQIKTEAETSVKKLSVF